MIEGTNFYLRNAGPRTVRVVVVVGGRHLDPTQKGIYRAKVLYRYRKYQIRQNGDFFRCVKMTIQPK